SAPPRRPRPPGARPPGSRPQGPRPPGPRPPGPRRPHAASRPAHAGPPRPGPPPPSGPARNVRLLIEYEGTRYFGWQVQKGQRPAAGDLRDAIAAVLRESPKLLGAGRTDQGVHAEGQVANFYTRTTLPAGAILQALNDTLPADINILEARDVPLSFHARHDA